MCVGSSTVTCDSVSHTGVSVCFGLCILIQLLATKEAEDGSSVWVSASPVGDPDPGFSPVIAVTWRMNQQREYCFLSFCYKSVFQIRNKKINVCVSIWNLYLKEL